MSEEDGAVIVGYPCSVRGQGDIYGIGIRVSLYVQWYSTTIAYLYDPRKATEYTVYNYLFSIAVAIASLVHRKTIYRHELVIIAVLLMLPPTVVVITALDHTIAFIRRKKKQGHKIKNEYSLFKCIRDCGGILATAFLLCVAVWEVFGGVNVSKEAPGCWPEFVRSFYIGGTYEVLFKVVAIIFAVLAPLFLIILVVRRIISARQFAAQQNQPTHSISEKLAPEGGEISPVPDEQCAPEERESSAAPTGVRSTTKVIGRFKVRTFVALIWGMVASFTIAKIETIIKQNQIQDLMDPLETGQLIPLVIGILQFCLVTYGFLVEARKAKKARDACADPVAGGEDAAK